MDQPISHYRRLIQDYINGRPSAAACEELFAFAQTENELFVQLLEEEEVHDLVLATIDADTVNDDLSQRIHARLLASINEQTRVEAVAPEATGPAPVKKMAWFRYAAAAAILVMIGMGAYWWVASTKKTPETAAIQPAQHDVPPGKTGAILTLANGKQILLDSAVNGLVATERNAAIIKNEGGISYQPNTQNVGGEVVYNTISTPKGRQYAVLLPDGSQVWLNAASTIRYPTVFTGTTRQVDITGEAYFEVAKNAAMPFIVRVGSPAGEKGLVKVLGTHFNVNSYDDEPAVLTTLLEGAVSVTKDASAAKLNPGQQSQLMKSGKLQVVDNADVEEAVAWKNGRLIFKKASIEAIMRQAARWYDVEVVFTGAIEDTYTVDVSRNVPVSRLLKNLEMTGGVHFIIEGKKITVTK